MIFSKSKRPKKVAWYYATILNGNKPVVRILHVTKSFKGNLAIWDNYEGWIILSTLEARDYLWGDEVLIPKIEFGD